MSIRLMNIIWDNTDEWLSGSRRLVMLALADNANDEAQCWPSIDTIAQKVNLGKRYTLDILKELAERGYIKRKRRYQTSTLYTLHVSKVSPASPISEPRLTSLVSPASLEPLVNHQEPSPDITERKARTLQALSRGLQGDAGIKQAIQIEFNLNPRWSNKDWQECVQFLKERKDGETIEKFAAWWKSKDWRGKDGQPPTAKNIIELWPQAFKPKKAEKPEIFWVDH